MIDNSFQNTKLTVKDYILCFLLIAISGINNFGGYIINTIVFIIILFIFFNQIKITRFFIFYILFVLFILIASAIQYSYFQLNNYLSLSIKIMTAYIIMYLLGIKFFKTYIKIIYILSIISLIFWTIFVLSPTIEKFFYLKITPFFDYYLYDISADRRPAPNFIIYTMNHWGVNVASEGLNRMTIGITGVERIFMRNSMCFGEPSVAMFFVIPALSFSLLLHRKINRKEIIVLILVIITSWSTGGFAVLFFLFIGWYLTQKGGKNIFIMLPLAMFIGYYTFINVESFGLELTEKIDRLRTSDIEYATRTRLVNAALDIQETLKHPLFGKGFFMEDRPLTRYDWRTNGTTYLLNRYGVIAFFLYFFLIYKYFNLLCKRYNINRSFALIMVAAIIFVGFGNRNFEKSLFIGFTMIYYIIKDQTQQFN